VIDEFLTLRDANAAAWLGQTGSPTLRMDRHSRHRPDAAKRISDALKGCFDGVVDENPTGGRRRGAGSPVRESLERCPTSVERTVPAITISRCLTDDPGPVPVDGNPG
jgi:plasmid stabilization system protein ParE